MQTHFNFHGLYAITAGASGQKLIDDAKAALEGGAHVLLFRDKTQDAVQRYHDATALKKLCAEFNIPFLVNDDLELAIAVAAEGVHLGQQDGHVVAARKHVSKDFIIGVTCHGSLALAESAQAGGADYVSFGACFPSPTKPSAPVMDLQVLTVARQKISVPIVAIGGITLGNAPQVLAAGADMLCVISDLFGAEDIARRAREYSVLF